VAFAFAAAVQIFNTFFALAKSAKQKNLFIYLLNFKALNHIDLSFCTLIKGQCVLVIFEIYSLIVI